MRGQRQNISAAWLITLVAATALLGLGASLGWEWREPEVINLRQAVQRQANRSGSLMAQIQSLENRLGKQKAELASSRALEDAGRSLHRPPPAGTAPESRLLHRGKAEMVLDGRVSLSLVEIQGRDQVAIRVRVMGGKSGLTVLTPGQDKSFVVDGRLWRLLLKSIHASSARVQVSRARARPRPKPPEHRP